MRIAVLDIGGTAIKYGIAESPDNVTPIGEMETRAKQDGGEGIVKKAEVILDTLAPFDAVGISTAGIADIKTGAITYANENIPHYTGIPLGEHLRSRYGVPVAVRNDVHAAAIGEATFGAGKAFRSFLCLTYGTGIGGAAFLNGQLLSGQTDSAGHFGHITTHRGGKQCGCGNYGCYEAYASVTALCALVKERTGEDLNGREIFARLDEPVIKQSLSDWIDEVVVGLASLIHAFNPEGVILGGGVFNESVLMDEIKTRLFTLLMPTFQQTVICKAALGNRAGLLGALAIAKDALLKAKE